MERRPLLKTKGRFNFKSIKMVSAASWEKYRVSTTNPVDFATWEKLIKTFNERIAMEAITNRNGVSLPYRLGTLFVASVEASKKPWRVARNLKVSSELGYSVEEPNLGTGGLQCKIIYSTYEERCTRPERMIWRFKGCRKFTRSLSKAFRVNWEMYLYLSPKTHLSEVYLDYKKKKSLSRIPLEVYNPLEA
jgi:hypothetical protein